MELSRHRRTASLNFGALLSKGSSIALTRPVRTVKDGDTSSTAAGEKLSEKTAGVQHASEQEQSLVNDYRDGDQLFIPAGIGGCAGNIPGPSGYAGNPKPGVKLDAGKAPVAQAFVAYFRKAMEAVAQVSAYGANKYKVAYSEQNWRKVENGQSRYADALQRHFAAHLAGETIDPESKQPHLAHVGWNAMALLELQDGLPEKLVDGQ